MSHYDWLDKHFPDICKKLGLNFNNFPGIVSCHGDKCSTDMLYSQEKHNIHPYHWVAMYLLSYVAPYSKECRIMKDGKWYGPKQWILDNKDKFLPFLPLVANEE